MSLKNLIAALIAALAGVTVCGAATVLAQDQSSVPQTEAKTSAVSVNLRLIRMLPEKLEFELTAQNSGNNAVFILTDPMRSNGSKGSYFTLDPQDPSILEICIQLYPSPNYSIYSNRTRVSLRRLNPGGTHVELITVSFPARETSPPYKGVEYGQLDRSKLRGARATVGILRDDEGVRDFLRRKEGIGPYAGGLELITIGPLRGKSLYEAQEIIHSPTIKF
ncbi:MAG TPA: hypothetical protein VJ784_07685 [Pyrinomonadaceae bacterium]|jgi:hypothetical protein|nr:hypothetical protein [Pyrinomonadaceae bacterium]